MLVEAEEFEEGHGYEELFLLENGRRKKSGMLMEERKTAPGVPIAVFVLAQVWGDAVVLWGGSRMEEAPGAMGGGSREIVKVAVAGNRGMNVGPFRGCFGLGLWVMGRGKGGFVVCGESVMCVEEDSR